MKNEFVIGVDVGTGSVRAGVFDITGKMFGYGDSPIEIWYPCSNFAEQSSEDIWRGVCRAVRVTMQQAGIKKQSIIGISFDATCSLVVLDRNNLPVTVSPTNKNEQNIIVWMDHRAKEETNFINDTHHKVLKYVGGKLSPEQQPAKLLWLKNSRA